MKRRRSEREDNIEGGEDRRRSRISRTIEEKEESWGRYIEEEYEGELIDEEEGKQVEEEYVKKKRRSMR